MPLPKQFARYGFVLFCLMLIAPIASLSADDADFPLPSSLEPAVEFWIRVYTQADTESGFLHDSQNLNIIYEKLSRDRDLIEDRRKAIAADLQVLAGGKRSELSASQQHILDLWGSGVSNERLTEAASNIRWQLGQSDRYQEGLYRSGAYLPHIRAAAHSLGVPEELAALPHVESSFHPGAFSSAAASGMFQFMRETGKRFMRVDNLVDERLDPYKSAHAAMKLLKDNYEDLGTWPLALTAYNHGTAGMARAVRDSGTRDIGEIVANYKGPRFGFASRNFYAQFLAAREVERNAERFFGAVARMGAPEFAEYEMNAFIDASVVAASLGVSLDTLKQDNPALLAPIWNGSKRIPKGYVVRVSRNNFAGDLAASFNTIASSNFHSDQVQDQTYTVQQGDSLSVIARLYNTSIAELVTINQLPNRNALKIGQKLILPQQNGTVPTLVVNATPPPAAPPPASGSYTVARGDTLSRIATRFNVPERTLMALNNIRDANRLQPGQTLILRAEQPVAVVERSVREEIARSVQAEGLPSAEQVSSSQQRQQAAAVVSMVHSMNPADYAVASDGSIEVLPEETLGHYADWLRVNSNDLHRLNNLRSQNAVRVGSRLRMDFSKVDQARFEARRHQFHSNLQSQYFATRRISDTTSYRIRPSDSLAALARANDIPMWLFRQYNPGVDAARIQIGQTVVIPRVQALNN